MKTLLISAITALAILFASVIPADARTCYTCTVGHTYGPGQSRCSSQQEDIGFSTCAALGDCVQWIPASGTTPRYCLNNIYMVTKCNETKANGFQCS